MTRARHRRVQGSTSFASSHASGIPTVNAIAVAMRETRRDSRSAESVVVDVRIVDMVSHGASSSSASGGTTMNSSPRSPGISRKSGRRLIYQGFAKPHARRMPCADGVNRT